MHDESLAVCTIPSPLQSYAEDLRVSVASSASLKGSLTGRRYKNWIERRGLKIKCVSFTRDTTNIKCDSTGLRRSAEDYVHSAWEISSSEAPALFILLVRRALVRWSTLNTFGLPRSISSAVTPMLHESYDWGLFLSKATQFRPMNDSGGAYSSDDDIAKFGVNHVEAFKRGVQDKTARGIPNVTCSPVCSPGLGPFVYK
jgi:hypothetical protein